MERDAAVRLVNRVLSREYNSVEGYILHSSPYATDEDDAALAVIQKIADAHNATAEWMTEHLRENFGAGPTIRAFEYWNTDLNYLSVPFLVRFALDHNRRVQAEYDETLKHVAGDAPLEAVFRRIRDEAKNHADALEKCLPKPPAPAPAPAAPAAAPAAPATPPPAA